VMILALFFFDGKHRLDTTSRYYMASLCFTAATAVVDIIAVSMLNNPTIPLWLNVAANTAYFLINILATSSIALYLFTRILEHSHNKRCMRQAKIGLTVCLSVFILFLILNLWTGWLFYFDEKGAYCRGPLNVLGYVVTVVQMILVLICYLRNKRNAGTIMRRVLIQTFPIVVVWIVVQRMHPEIMMNSFIMSMMNTVLFLTFNGQRPGVQSLTRLDDRHRFLEDLERHIKNRDCIQVFMVSIKNFGVINQKHGHLFGDELLYQFAFSLEKLIADSEAFHMNGTVFALTIPYRSRYKAQKHLAALTEFLEAGIEFGGEHTALDYIAVEYLADSANTTAVQIYEVLEYAVAKTYREKKRYVCCTKELEKEMMRRQYIVERIQNIDHEHGFRVWYQPIFCVSSGKFCSMEALVRLVEPDGTMIAPGEFIGIAEETGRVKSITWFVLEEVCKMLKNHSELDDVSVSINLPMAQLLEKGFQDRMNVIVDSYGIEHRRICLEFTERAILENFEQIKSVMKQFTAEGYRFFLDDFGAGYSNFNCLLQLPFQVIKLDMDLIRMDIDNNGHQSLGLIKTLAGFLREIEMTVVAEGIETSEMAQAIVDMGIDRIQGYAYAKPMPSDKLLNFYGKQSA